MKTFILQLIVALSLFANMRALTGVSSFTLSDPCTPQVTITAIPESPGCYSIVAANSNTAVNDPDSYYNWQFASGTTGTGKVIIHCCPTVTVTTAYTFTLTYNTPVLCGVQPNVFTYTITLNPSPQNPCNSRTVTVLQSANTVSVSAGVTIPEIFFSFDYGDNSPVSGNYVHTYANCGNYIIKVKSWDMNNPSDSCVTYAAVNIACPTGISDHCDHPVLSVFPNPVGETLQIISSVPVRRVIIMDFNGRKILDFDRVMHHTLNVSDLPAGIYFVNILLEDGSVGSRRLMKE